MANSSKATKNLANGKMDYILDEIIKGPKTGKVIIE